MKRMLYCILGGLILLAGTVSAAESNAEGSPSRHETVPWGDLVFLDNETILVPYAIEERADAATRREARESLERWQHLPEERVVDELLSNAPNSETSGSALARALTRLFVRHIRESPEQAERQIEALRWVRELGLRIMRITPEELHELRRIPVWRGRHRVDDRVEQVPGEFTTVVEGANLRVGIRAGRRYIVAWVGEYLPGGAALFIDRASFRPVALEPGFMPLAWRDDEHLLGWRRNERAQPMIGIYALSDTGTLHTLSGPGRNMPAHARRLIQVRPLYTGAPPLSAVIVPPPLEGPHERAVHARSDRVSALAPLALLCNGSRAALLDLRSGRRTQVLEEAVLMGCPVAAGHLIWALVDQPGGARLISLERRGQDLHIIRAHALPQPRFWFGPLAADLNRIWLVQDPGHAAPASGGSGGVSYTTRRDGVLWSFTQDAADWRRWPLPRFRVDSGKIFEGARLAALSPDGYRLAVRLNRHTVKVLDLAGAP